MPRLPGVSPLLPSCCGNAAAALPSVPHTLACRGLVVFGWLPFGLGAALPKRESLSVLGDRVAASAGAGNIAASTASILTDCSPSALLLQLRDAEFGRDGSAPGCP